MKKRVFLSVGIPSILMIFLVLCLVTFSLLSLSSAKADSRLSEKMADHTKAYYTACSQANHLLEETDGILARLYASSENETAYFNGLAAAFPDHEIWLLDSRRLSFSVPIEDQQLLQVTLDLHYPAGADENFWTVSQWQTVNTQEWEKDDSLNLYK